MQELSRSVMGGMLGLNKHKPDEGFMRAAMAASVACLKFQPREGIWSLCAARQQMVVTVQRPLSLYLLHPAETARSTRSIFNTPTATKSVAHTTGGHLAACCR